MKIQSALEQEIINAYRALTSLTGKHKQDVINIEVDEGLTIEGKRVGDNEGIIITVKGCAFAE